MKAIILNHPLVKHKLSILRDKGTGTKEFREIIGELSSFLCYEALRDAIKYSFSYLKELNAPLNRRNYEVAFKRYKNNNLFIEEDKRHKYLQYKLKK